MYRLLVILMIASAIQQLGLNFKDLSECKSRECIRKLDHARNKILHIDWKPISVFPEEAKRFK